MLYQPRLNSPSSIASCDSSIITPPPRTEKAKTRPGIDYFPTDQAMMADFVKRKPEVFITQVLNG